MSEHEHIDWLRERLRISLAIEQTDPSELLDWLERRRKEVPFSAELIPLAQVENWHRTGDGNICSSRGRFFAIEGVRVRSTSGVREVSGWDQPILTQAEGGVLAFLCRETPDRGVEFLLQCKAEPGNIGYVQLCATIQSTWHTIRGMPEARRTPFVELLEPNENVRVIYRSMHNEEGARFWRKSNENMILFVNDSSRLTIDASTYQWASLSQIKRMMLLDNVVGPYARTVIAPL